MQIWTYMGLQIDPERLIGKQELLDRLASNGANYRALAEIRDEQAEAVGKELAWHYPISDGDNLGAFIFPVKQGFLWIPYNEALRHEGELLEPNRAFLMDEDFCEMLESDLRNYSDALCKALRDMKNVASCPRNDRGDEKMSNQAQKETAKTTIHIVVDFNTSDNLIELYPYAKREDAVAHWLRLYEQSETDGEIFEEVCPGIRFKAWFKSDRSNYHECEIYEEDLR